MRSKLRSERVRRGMSVRGLAAEVGISPSALSQIERGRSRPSVTTLYAIVSALGMSFDSLFDGGSAGWDPPDDSRGHTGAAMSDAGRDRPRAAVLVIRRAQARRSIEFTAGVRWDRLSPPGDAVEALWLTYPPGAASGDPGRLTRHSGHEYGIVIEGRLAVSVGFETYELGPGDAITFQSAQPHQLRSIGPDAATAVWFVRDGPSQSSSDARASRDT